MLRAGLIGFPSSGKTALFQLLTSAREAPRHAGAHFPETDDAELHVFS